MASFRRILASPVTGFGTSLHCCARFFWFIISRVGKIRLVIDPMSSLSPLSTMQAVIQVGSKQYKVAKDTVFFAELTSTEIGKDFKTSEVLSVNNNGQIKIGQPFVSGASVTAKVLEEVKGPKIVGVFYRTKKHNHRKWGHRQKYHKLQVTAIQA